MKQVVFRSISISLGISMFLFVASSPSVAQGITTYEYDALGRLVGTNTDGGANDGLDTDYEYDPAGNRQRVVVSGSTDTPPTGGGSGGIIVLPINGFLVIPISSSN